MLMKFRAGSGGRGRGGRRGGGRGRGGRGAARGGAPPARGARGGARGRGGRGRGGYGRGRGRGRGPLPATTGPVEKTLPQFIKIDAIKPNGRSFDIVVKVASVNADATRVDRRGPRQITTKVTEALVGDETGAITLQTRFPEKATDLKEGAVLAILNVRMRRGGDRSWIDVDTWSTIKPVDGCKDLLPADFKTDFDVNKDKDRSKRVPPKPKFEEINSLLPEQRGVHLLVKVLDAKVEERKRADGSVSKITEATVGDSSARITAVARGPHGESLKKDAVLALFNSHIEMSKGFMRLVVDRWSDVKPLAEVDKALLPEGHVTESSTIPENDKSKQEWMLQEETA